MDNKFNSNKKPNKSNRDSYAPQLPKDRSHDRNSFGTGHNKFADWSEGELWNYLGFLKNKPNPEDLEENPEGGYRV